MKKKHLFGSLTLQTKDLTILNDTKQKNIKGGWTILETCNDTISYCNDQCSYDPSCGCQTEANTPGCPSSPDPLTAACCQVDTSNCPADTFGCTPSNPCSADC